MEIQDYLTCVIQNIRALVRYGYSPKKSPAVIVQQIKQTVTQAMQAGSDGMRGLGRAGLLGKFPPFFRSTGWRLSILG